MMGPTCVRSIRSSREKVFRRTSAATPCGDSLGTRLSNNLSGKSSVSTCAPICGSRRSARSCADSRKNTALMRSPLRMASSTMRKPSMAQSPESVSSLRENAWRSCLINGLCRPSMRRRCSWALGACSYLFFIWICSMIRRSPRCSPLPYYCKFHQGKHFNWRAGRKGSAVRAAIVKINSESPEGSLVKDAAEQMRAGEVLGMPTETFYGLAADPFNLRAVDRVYEIKTRSRHKPLSLLIESEEQAEELARPLPDEFYKLARRFWPGPLTIIVKAASRLPLKVTANTGNVALRVPSAKIPLAVVQAAKIPITATSANLSGESECTTAEAVRDQLQERISIIVDGGTSPRETASTIVDLTDEEARWRIMREGAISAQDISEFFAQG